MGALPLNGGAYNALLNTTSKSTASLAATLTLLSYMATTVISASEAMHYVHSIWPVLPVMCLFGLGNILLKVKRKKLPRTERASPMAILLAIMNRVMLYIKNNEHTKKKSR